MIVPVQTTDRACTIMSISYHFLPYLVHHSIFDHRILKQGFPNSIEKLDPYLLFGKLKIDGV